MRDPRTQRRLAIAAVVAAVVIVVILLLPRGGEPGPSPSASSSPGPSATTGSADPSTATPSGEPSPSDGASASPSASAGASPDASPSDGGGPVATGTATWEAVQPGGGSPAARSEHTLTVDPSSGIAVLVGGLGSGGALDDAWTYELGADAWTPITPTGDLPGPLARHGAVWIDGLGVVVVGGVDAAGTAVQGPWALDPATGTWRALAVAGERPVARSEACLAVAPDGAIWLSHGLDVDGSPLGDTWSYDPGDGAWTERTVEGAGPGPRGAGSCWWASDGRFVVFGGRDGDRILGDVWALDVGSETWTTVRPTSDVLARSDATTTRYNDRIVVAGGLGADGTPATDVLAFDVGTLAPTRFPPDGPAPAGRTGPAIAEDPGGERLLLFGGQVGGTPSDETWSLALR